MKVVEYYTGTNCVQICYSGYNWLTRMETLTSESYKLQVEARRILKAVGFPIEFCEYDVNVSFSDRKLFISVSSNREMCKAIVAEAKKRHFKEMK